MGNKLAMVTTRSRKKSKRRSNKKRSYKIKDVPLSKHMSEGSRASLGSINYHYQKYYNTFAFLKEILKSDPSLSKMVCIPDVGEGWMQSFLKVHFFKSTKAGVFLDSVKPVDPMDSKETFVEEIQRCMSHRFIPISLEIIVPRVGTHANVLLIDSKLNTVELFEPHGGRNSDSELESISRAYYKINKNIKRFFKQYFPRLKFISPSTYEPTEGLQARLDAFSGLCVTWSIMYLHYRILNPDVSPKKLVEYMEHRVTRPFLLKYTKYVEDTLKHKH